MCLSTTSSLEFINIVSKMQFIMIKGVNSGIPRALKTTMKFTSRSTSKIKGIITFWQWLTPETLSISMGIISAKLQSRKNTGRKRLPKVTFIALVFLKTTHRGKRPLQVMFSKRSLRGNSRWELLHL
jgi:hypothetical protein